jgi:hypothetical protein
LALLGASVAVAGPARAHGTPGRGTPGVTAATALARLLHEGAIGRGAYDSYRATYAEANRSLSRLSGMRRGELAAVLANVEAMARAGQLTPSRLPVAFATLKANREWWTTKPLPAANQRVSLPGSRLVWERYPEQGIEIQWLGTFGEANHYYLSHETQAFEQVLREAIGLATQRAGGIAWEYLFRFDGGSPPWTSALSQGTALQALARAWSATKKPEYLTAAQRALGIFRVRPPEGVLAPTSGPAAAPGPGRWYLQYSYAPGDRIVNGFIQALVGLYDYTKLSGDPLGQQLFEAGDARARMQLPRFDTGAWSRYDQSSESDLSYHDLLTEFLEHMCERTREGEPLAGVSAPAGASAQTGGSGGTGESSPNGGSGGTGESSATGGAGQIPGDEIYCTTASRFRDDLKTPPIVRLLTRTVNAGERAGVQVRLSKVSTVRMTIALAGRTVWTSTITLEGGTPRLLWATPSKPGRYSVVLRATDLAGNEESASGSVTVSRRVAPKRASARAGGLRVGVVGGARGATSRARGTASDARSEPISPAARRLPVP